MVDIPCVEDLFVKIIKLEEHNAALVNTLGLIIEVINEIAPENIEQRLRKLRIFVQQEELKNTQVTSNEQLIVIRGMLRILESSLGRSI